VFWAISSQTHLVTLTSSPFFKSCGDVLVSSPPLEGNLSEDIFEIPDITSSSKWLTELRRD
jgi:hypothetical protein